jgi:peptidoglycan/xylan/chitin deacetylase (PgdA/CDA1 family)
MPGTINVNLHGIGAPARPLEPGEDEFWIDEDALGPLLDAVRADQRVRLSFDDGNASDLQIALPALVDRGMTADFFVVAGRLGAPGSLDADGVRELHRAGMRIGNHGMRHRSWREARGRERREELVEARAMLSEVVGGAVDVAACPRGDYDRSVLADLRDAGYLTVFTSDARPAGGQAWLQPRFTVRRGETPASLRAGMLRPRPARQRVVAAGKGLVKRCR